MPVCIDSAPKITLLATDQDVGFVDVPIEACAPKASFGSFGQFRTKLLNPPVDGRPIHRDATFFEKIDDILI